MSLQFDNKISLGHVLTFVAMLVGGIVAYADLRSGQSRLVADVAASQAADENHEARLRAVEVAQASQSSDLRAIQASLVRIERLIEALP